MPLDPYASCPGGTGKKIKFCCPDLGAELEKIEKMLAAEQRHACLEHLEQLERKFPNRACLMTTKALLLNELGELDKAAATVAATLTAFPENPVALAEAALLTADKQGASAGVTILQRAIAASAQEMSPRVYEALVGLSQLLLLEGLVPAAIAHLHLALALNPEDRSVHDMFIRLHASPSVPLLLKQTPEFAPAPGGAAWKNEFDAAMAQARKGLWLDAQQRLAALAETAVDVPAVWRSLAELRGALADMAGAVAAWRKYASLDIPLEDAVEAEARAQLLEPPAGEDLVESVQITYPIHDMERLTAALASDRRVLRMQVRRESFPEGTPPPRMALSICDKVGPDSVAELSLDTLSTVLGQALVFGRETDREARLVVSAYRDRLAAVDQVLREVAGDAFGQAAGEEVVGRVSRVERLLEANWQVPTNTPEERVHELTAAQRRRALLEQWPQTPLARLGGRTPEQAAGDPAARVALLAGILVLQMSLGRPSALDLTNQLRAKLGLPTLDTIDPATVDVRRLPPVRLERLDVARLSDDQLIDAQNQATFLGAGSASRKLAAELVSRPGLGKEVDKAPLYALMASLSESAAEAIEMLRKAEAAAVAGGKSCARYDLEELVLHLRTGQGGEAARMLEHLQTRHATEPGVRNALLQLMYQAGLIGPDGRPTTRDAAEAAMVPAAAAEPGKLWTPDSDVPAGKKSALWVPGE